MWFGDWNNAAAADAALQAVRSVANFNWTFIFILAVVVALYINEIKNKNYKSVVAGLSLYAVHWLYEIANAVIRYATGYALWTVSGQSTSFVLLIGVSWELSMMFSVAGLIMSKLLPDDPKKKIFGINNRIVFAIGNAAFFSLVEVFLATTPAFIWVYPWWGAVPVFVTTYIPFFLAAFLVPDAKPKVRRAVLITLWSLVVILLAVLIPLKII
jgi:hypothetical protein